MPKFTAQLRDKIQGCTYAQTIEADTLRDAKEELESSSIQVVSIRQHGAPRETAPRWDSTKRLKNRLAMQQAREQQHEAGMLGEDFDLRAAYLDNRAKLG